MEYLNRKMNFYNDFILVELNHKLTQFIKLNHLKKVNKDSITRIKTNEACGLINLFLGRRGGDQRCTLSYKSYIKQSFTTIKT
jgi:hypothetical protein